MKEEGFQDSPGEKNVRRIIGGIMVVQGFGIIEAL
jgi:hypothetical protein